MNKSFICLIKKCSIIKNINNQTWMMEIIDNLMKFNKILKTTTNFILINLLLLYGFSHFTSIKYVENIRGEV